MIGRQIPYSTAKALTTDNNKLEPMPDLAAMLPIGLDIRLPDTAATGEIRADNMKKFTFGGKSLLKLIGSGKGGILNIKEFHAQILDTAECDIGHSSAKDRFDIIGSLFIRPG